MTFHVKNHPKSGNASGEDSVPSFASSIDSTLRGCGTTTVGCGSCAIPGDSYSEATPYTLAGNIGDLTVNPAHGVLR
jgi:hypothetical protein